VTAGGIEIANGFAMESLALPEEVAAELEVVHGVIRAGALHVSLHVVVASGVAAAFGVRAAIAVLLAAAASIRGRPDDRSTGREVGTEKIVDGVANAGPAAHVECYVRVALVTADGEVTGTMVGQEKEGK
jgi:hypothetical protein